MALSTFSEIHLVLLKHYRTTLTTAYGNLFQSPYQFVFSPADDEESDFRRLEEVRKDLKAPDDQVVLPACVLSMTGVGEVWRQFSGRERFGVGAAGSAVSGSMGAPIVINYKLKLYCKTFDECISIMEVFLLLLGDIRRVEYTSAILPGKRMPLTLTYMPAQPARLSGAADKYAGRGHIYVASYEVSASGVIVLTAIETFRRILKTSQSPFRIGVSGNLQMEVVPPDYHDMLEDSITTVDTLVNS